MSDIPNDANELMEDVGLPRGAQPDPDNPGWYSWGDFPRSSFAASTVPAQVRKSFEVKSSPVTSFK